MNKSKTNKQKDSDNSAKSLNGMCQCCMMPFKKDPKGSDREHNDYCSYCYENGKLNYQDDDVKEFKKAMVEAMVKRGEPKFKAKFFAFMAGFAPRWKKSKK